MDFSGSINNQVLAVSQRFFLTVFTSWSDESFYKKPGSE
jgi:hypothetical protein